MMIIFPAFLLLVAFAAVWDSVFNQEKCISSVKIFLQQMLSFVRSRLFHTIKKQSNEKSASHNGIWRALCVALNAAPRNEAYKVSKSFLEEHNIRFKDITGPNPTMQKGVYILRIYLRNGKLIKVSFDGTWNLS